MTGIAVGIDGVPIPRASTIALHDIAATSAIEVQCAQKSEIIVLSDDAIQRP